MFKEKVMRINKTLLITNIALLCFTLVLYAAASVCNGIFGLYNFTSNIILCLSAAAAAVGSAIYLNRKSVYKSGVSTVNLIVSTVFLSIVLIVYFLPFWGFWESRGINNSICFIMSSAFGTEFFLTIAGLSKARSDFKNSIKSINSLKHSFDIFKLLYIFFKTFAVFVLAGTIIVSIADCFFHFIDLSKMFSAFSDLDLHITVLGHRIR